MGLQKLLTNIISLIRFDAGESNILEPFSETVGDRFNGWLAEQMGWLIMVKNNIASSASISMED